MSILLRVCVIESSVGIAKVEVVVVKAVGEEVGVVGRREQVVIPIVPSAAIVQEDGTMDPPTRLIGYSGYNWCREREIGKEMECEKKV